MAIETILNQLINTVDNVLVDNTTALISAEDLNGLFKLFLTYSVDSAYEIWKEQGGVGTKSEFLFSLRGERGVQGQTGTFLISDLEKIISANTKAEQAIAIANTANLQGVRLGAWNASTNTPALTADASAVVQGGFYDVVVAGTQAITGTSRLFVAGERIAKIEEHWYAIPNSLSEKSVTPEKTTFVEYISNPNYLAGFVDANDNALMLFRQDGYIEGLFLLKPSQVTEEFLSDPVKQKLPTISENNFTDKRVLWIDEDDNILSEYTKEGRFRALFDFSLSKIQRDDLSTSISKCIGTENANNFLKYLEVWLDEEDNVILGLTKDGQIEGSFRLLDEQIKEANLEADLRAKLPSRDFLRRNNYNDEVGGYDDNLFRGSEVDIPVYTNEIGSLHKTLPLINTNIIKGINDTNTILSFKRTSSLVVRGKNNAGSVSPLESNKLVRNMGWFRSEQTLLPHNPTIGDFWICIFWYLDPKQKMIENILIKEWDILYYSSTGFRVQASPLSSSLLKDDDYFLVSQAGKFWNLELNIDDKLIFLGVKTGGGYNEPIWIKQKEGDFFYMGSIIPDTFTPTSFVENSFFYCSSSGSFSGLPLAKGDYLIRKNLTWSKESTETKQVGVNEYFSFGCYRTAKEWSVKREDNANTSVLVKTKTNIASLSRVTTKDIVLYSDSMFGANVGTSIQSLLPDRQVSIESYGGASSKNILSKVKHNIRLGDPYKSRTHVFWHGQNNQLDTAQIKASALEMYELSGSSDSRCVFWSMLGQIAMQFNGTRIACANHEDAYLGLTTSRFVETERWYDAIFKSKHFSTRKAALTACAGRTRKHLQFPGKTEAEVATIYGIPAFSFFFNFSSVLWNPDNLIFLGYFDGVGLPTGGSNNQYFLRTANGNIGQIIVKVNDVWIEYNHDVTHVSPEGGGALANQFLMYLNQNNY